MLSQAFGCFLQVELVRDDVGNITVDVQDAIPPGENVDISPLTNARTQLNRTYTDLQDDRENVNNYLNIIEKVIFVLGACAFAVGIWGFVTLLVRVRNTSFCSVILVATHAAQTDQAQPGSVSVCAVYALP